MSYKVALIEDEKDLAEIYGLKMKMDGVETVIINDSNQALEILNKEKPQLILLDIMMPDVNGFELFGKLKADKNLKSIPVYIWSNLTQKKDLEHAKSLKVNGYLIKSEFTPAVLAKKVKAIIDKK